MRANKWGKLRIVRFLLIGWTFQAVHTLDLTEKLFRIVFEGVLFILFVLWYRKLTPSPLSWISYIAIFAILHTVVLLINGAGLDGLRECFEFIKNPGIEGIISYLLIVRKLIVPGDAAECILVYGSMTRNMFHDRSDLDVRIIRRTGIWRSLYIMLLAIGLRAIAAWLYHIPLDLKVVDSMDYLKAEMRSDEKPIVVYCRPGFEIFNRGVDLTEVCRNPSVVLRPSSLQE